MTTKSNNNNNNDWKLKSPELSIKLINKEHFWNALITFYSPANTFEHKFVCPLMFQSVLKLTYNICFLIVF